MDSKVGVVTGAGGDIGRAVCEELGQRGVKVLAVDLTEELARKGADAVTKAGGTGHFCAADVSTEAGVAAYTEEARKLWGEAHFFFNNAGIEGPQRPLLSYPADEWDRVLGVNLRGVFLGIRSMAHLLQHSDNPRIVNTASVAGLIATPMLAAYGTSKHAVIGLTKTAAVELAPLGISVNAICPGPVDSQMMRRIESGIAPGADTVARQSYEKRTPQGRYASLTEVANLACYLLLDSPSHMTGQAIAVDGGLAVS